MDTFYTHKPPLRKGLLRGSWQLFAWLLFHPTAWRQHVRRIDPALSPGFSLAELSARQLRHPEMRRLLALGAFVWTVGTAVPVFLLSLIGGASFVDRLLAAGVAVFLGWVIGLFLGTAVSWLLGVVVGWVGGAALGLGAALFTGGAAGMAARFVFGVGWGVIFGLMSGAAAYTLLASRTRPASLVSWLRQTRAILIGGAASVLLLLILFTLITIAVAREQQLGLSARLAATPYLLSVAGLAVAMTLLFTLIITGRTQNWRRGVVLGSALGAAYGGILSLLLRSATVDYILFLSPSGQPLAEMTGGRAFYAILSVIMAALYAGLLAFAFALLERLAGEWAGAAAGVMASVGTHLALGALVTMYRFWPNVGVSLLLVALGAALPRWRPWLTWPLQQVGNWLLLQFDRERRPSDPPFLRRHAAFWDEQQFLRLRGLDQHLALAHEQDPAEAAAAMVFLQESRQRWAVTAARLEILARQLERFEDIDELQTADVPEVETAVAPILHRFRRFSRDVEAALRQSTGHHRRLALEGALAQWTQFTQGLSASQEETAVRFYPAACRWLEIVEAYLDELTAVLEATHEIDNPYIFGAPITEEQEIFVGRQDIIGRIEHHLLDIRRPPLLLYGQRRMGKTSLLRNLGRLFTSEIVPMFVDGQGASLAADYSGFLHGVARQMARSAERYRGLALPPLAREALTDSPFTALEMWLDRVEATLDESGHRVALIAFDEVETLQQGMARGRFDERDVLSFFRHVIQHRPRFKVLLASSHMLAEFPPHWSSYLINMQTVKISYLDEASARALVERPSPQFPLRYQPEAVETILAWTRGHPYLLQLLCHELVTLKNSQPPEQRRLATAADVEAAAAQALVVGQLFFEDITRNQVDDAGRAALVWLAGQEERGVAEAVLAQQAGAETIARLKMRDLIETVDGVCRFQTPLVRRWFTTLN